MYADNTHTTIASDDINELAQMMREELQNFSEWMRINKLSANPKKGLSLCSLVIHAELIKLRLWLH